MTIMDSETKKMLGEILAAVKGLEGRISKLESGAAAIGVTPHSMLSPAHYDVLAEEWR